MFIVKVVGHDLYYTVYGVRQDGDKIEFLLHESYWHWDDAENYKPVQQ